ncbi:metallophosphoesterase [Oceanirhabdus sp. W0125-5]|uniref:metallophosphoesterase n=1 Tax=Oceanirhabdus sp. W0125-5 TaxID=2999116 RepID=UPI0022F31D9A|nr:metallophosphoesterase [Oceanirhabdus sp. W0125-5]WBW99080.1 metallophosphoesterase [Oceanirhabdus sp. W0125-5]
MNLISALTASLLITARIIYEVNFTKINTVKIESSKLKNIDELRVMQITDFHNKKMFSEKKYKKIIEKCNPHFIVITGDIISKNHKEFSSAYRLIKILLDYTDKVFFVMGNHECSNKRSYEFLNEISNMGVNILDNKSVVLKIGQEKINICGASDARSQRDNLKKTFNNVDFTKLSILLSHSPQILDRDEYIECELTLLGDTHGGQIRLPFIGALFTSQGMFPKLQKGLYFLKGKDRAVYIDSGVGVHSLPIRFLNRSQMSLIRVINKHKNRADFYIQ